MEFNNKEIRFEKKWIFSLNDKFILLNILKKKGFFFKKSFPNRRVNNLYYDTKNFKSLADNLNGISSREKLRARWYGDFSKSKSIFIEKKIKQNQIGYKNKYNLTHEVDFTDLKSINKLNKYIRNTFSLSNQQVVPVLFNNYERIYTSSKIFPEIRCTLDFNLKSFIYNPIIFPKSFKTYPYLILEIKYPVNKDNLVKKILMQYNLSRISKSSKYVSMYVNSKFV